ncbi:putative tRNA binding domain containing protein [Blattamonas nauphoetae]|uniref:tRNA binding domain containing protein n=1 Tax=Blattamonas nauphoetae TaxID=2049346 RepID=A0ABQ9XG75_9EUKA|nr:putative tRNA binding domain containing protein [Blattamonas nauphoetae]
MEQAIATIDKIIDKIEGLVEAPPMRMNPDDPWFSQNLVNSKSVLKVKCPTCGYYYTHPFETTCPLCKYKPGVEHPDRIQFDVAAIRQRATPAATPAPSAVKEAGKQKQEKKEQPPKPAKGGKNVSEADKQAALDQSFALCKFQMIKLTDCKKHPDADKLIVCTAHLSETETSTLVTGLIPHYQPEDLEGRVVCSVVNLKPKKMMGIEGHVMLLAATDKVSGKCILLQPPEGSQIGDRIYPTGFTLAEGWKEGDVSTAQKATTQEAAEVPKGRFEKVVNGFKVETELPKFYGKPLVTARGPIKIEGICDGSEFH